VPEWLISLAILGVGVALLIGGGDLLVRGAVALATRLGISPLIIGLTVVAFGTSAPELALNVSAALNGNTDLSFGNIIGSNIANIGLILGLSAMVRPMLVHSALLRREIPVMILISLAVLVMSMTPPHSLERIGFARAEGIGLLVAFAVFLEVMRRAARKGDAELVEEATPETPINAWLGFGLLIGGLLMLAFGGSLAERGAVGVARAVGLSDAVIGLTVVAVATSLPELATSVMAARRNQIDIAVGNVVGSNIFNILLVLGATATIAPTPSPVGGLRSLIVMVALAVLLVPLSRTHNGTISRAEGTLLLAIYLGTMAYEVWAA
jgi:cation:H+ antiporter